MMPGLNFIQPTAAASVSKHSENGGWRIEEGQPPQIHPPSSTHPAPAGASGDGGPEEKFQSVIERLSGFFSEAHLPASVDEAICEPPTASTPARQRPAFAPGTVVTITTAAPKRSFRPGVYSPEGEDRPAAELAIVAVPFFSTGKAGSSQASGAASDAEQSPKSKVQSPKPDLGLWSLDFGSKFAPSGKRDEWRWTSGTKDGAASVSKQSENGGWSIEDGKPSQIHPPPSPHPAPTYAPGYGAAETLVAAKRSEDGPVAKLAVAAATVCASDYSPTSGAEPTARSEPVVRSTNSPANPKTEPSGESAEWLGTSSRSAECGLSSAEFGVRSAEFPTRHSALRIPHSPLRASNSVHLSSVTPLTPATAALSRILSELDARLAQTGIKKTDLPAITADGEIPQVTVLGSGVWGLASREFSPEPRSQKPEPVTCALPPVTIPTGSSVNRLASAAASGAEPTARSAPAAGDNLPTAPARSPCGVITTDPNSPPDTSTPQGELGGSAAPAATVREDGAPELGEDGPAKDSMDLPETPQLTSDKQRLEASGLEPRASSHSPVTCALPTDTIPTGSTSAVSSGNQFALAASASGAEPVARSAPALDSTNFADGTVVAQQDAAMKKTAKKTICSEAKQNLPASASGSGAAAPETGEFLPVAAKRSEDRLAIEVQNPESRIQNPESKIGLSTLDIGLRTNSGDGISTNTGAASAISPGAGNLTHVPPAVPQYLERTRELVSLQVMRLQESGAEEMRVVIQPDSGLQLTLHLQQRGGGVEMQAVLDRGNFGLLNRHWPELQQQLELRGVRVAPLANAEPSFGGGSEGFRQPTTSHGQPAGDDAEPAALPAVLIPGLPPATATASASAISPRRLETWA
jgi:hypothetical protein